MQIKSENLRTELKNILAESMRKAEHIRTLNLDKVNLKREKDAWSTLQCIEHLNNYGNYYLPEIEQRIKATRYPQPRNVFKSGVLGNYFANLMKGNKGKIKKMKSPEGMKPDSSELTHTTTDRFIKQLEKLSALVDQAYGVDWGRTKTSISLSPLIKLRLGDTLRFLVYHIERHLSQAERAYQVTV